MLVGRPQVFSKKASSLYQLMWKKRYFPETRQQYRFSGVAKLVVAPTHRLYALNASRSLASTDTDWEAIRQTQFRNLSPQTRAQFTWPDPKQPRTDTITHIKTLEEDSDNGKLWASALNNFALILLDPRAVDFLELLPWPNRRTLFEVDVRGGWIRKDVNP